MNAPLPPAFVAQQTVTQSVLTRRWRARQRAVWLGIWGLGFFGLSAASVVAGYTLGTALALALTALPAMTVGVLARAERDQATAWPDRPHRIATWILALWATAPTVASALTGGLAGPLGAIVFAPLAGGLALRSEQDERPVIFGAAASLAAIASGALVSAFVPPADAPPLFTSIIGLMLAGMGLWAVLNTRNTVPVVPVTLARMESALAAQPGLTLVLSPQGRALAAYGAAPPAIDINDLFQQVDAQGGLIESVHPPDRPAVRAALSRAQAGMAAQVRFTPRAALDRRVLLTVRRMQEDGRRLAAILLDATLQHARETELDAARQEAEAAAAARARFIAHMSHELRTPLNAVLGFSDAMRHRIFGPLPDRYADYASSIHQAGSHLLDMISNVLDVSRIDADRYELTLEPLDARDVADAALALVRMQAEEKSVSLLAKLPEQALSVTADRRAVKQILVNLLANAVKFTPEGGQVSLVAAIADDTLNLTVTDTGVGIAPQDLVRLGKPYEQAGDARQKALGTGLGLSLARSLAELHGGTLTLQSTLGEGTVATLSLPVDA